METQAHVQMAHGEIQEERTKELVEEIQEERFLKDLYLFMKNRDTPIERIPHMGFKQIDLFVMFKTVNDLGGYHQVTAQQLWKQVYNTLGGNPRSTSAATCTCRHYEKLLLPYECHMKGVLLNTLPQHQPKHFHQPSNSKEDDDGQRPAKRNLLSIPLHQAHVQMAHGQMQEERTKDLVEEIQEERFLKDLYLFMKNRDTPIEKIPHLGFKQIDLFVMFKTVKDLGGYHQVTAQQLWKQVYNTLGGNPRSTSAATCTRRHYEKLLLPYECHMKGVLLNTLPQHQPKHFHYPSNSKEDDDGQRPAKRNLLSIPLHQNPHHLQSDPHGSVFSLPLHHPHYYRPSHTILPPFVPISSSVLTSHNSPASQARFAFHPPHPNPTERIKEPLEHLRYLAEQYKTSSGLTEPLNLSVKASSRETNTNPTSSFAPLSSTKNPKFLNKPSPLYTPLHPQVVRNEACETQDGEADLEVTPYPVKAMEGYVIDLTSKTASSSPIYDSAPTLRTDESTSAMAPKASSPKTDFTIRPTEEREGSPEVRRLNLSHILPSPPQENGGKMEIEIPLSVFHNWLRLCGSSAMMHGAKQLHPPFQEEQRYCSNTDILPTNMTFQMNAQHHEQSSAIEDLRLTPRNVPSPTLNIQTTGNHHNTSHHHFTSYKPLPSSGILKNAASQDVYPDQQDINKSYGFKLQNCWNAYDKESQAPTIQVRTDSSPLTVLQDLTVTKSYNEDTNQGGKEKSEMRPSALLMLNSSSLLHLTTEEVMKLKKIISSS